MNTTSTQEVPPKANKKTDSIIDGLISIPISIIEEAAGFLFEIPKLFFNVGKAIANIILPDKKNN